MKGAAAPTGPIGLTGGYLLIWTLIYAFSGYYNVWFYGGYHYLETIDIRDHQNDKEHRSN